MIDNLDLYEMHERKRAREMERTPKQECRKINHLDEVIEVAFSIEARREDIGLVENYLQEYGYEYTREEF